VLPKTGEKPANRLREATALLDSPQISAMFEKVRATVAPPPPEPPPVEPPRIDRRPRYATAGLVVLVLATWWCYGPSRSPAMRLTLPGGARSGSIVAGEQSLYNGDFFQNENLVALKQLDLLKGNGDSPTEKIAVGDQPIGYAVLSNLFTVGLSSPYALWGLNLAAYALCAWLVARLTGALFDDPIKSKLAAALFVLSIAATVHVGELNPHLLAIAFCYLWTFLLLRIELEQKPFTGSTLFGLSALLGAWSLVSTTSIFGLVTLAICLLKKRDFLGVLLPVLAWYAVPQLQQALFARIGLTWPLETGSSLVWQGIRQHAINLAGDPLRYGCYLTVELGNFLFNDNPLNVVVGLIGLFVLRHRANWLLWTCFFTPLIVSLLALPTTAARGAAVAGNTILLFAIISHFAVEASRRLGRSFVPRFAPLPLVMLLVVQAVWSHSILIGWLYPAGSYVTGGFENAGLFRPTDFVRMIGPPEETPTATGGTVLASNSYGLGDGFGRQSVLPAKRLAPYAERWSGLPSLLKTLALQIPLFVCLLAAALALMRLRWGLLVTVLLVAWLGATQLCGAATGIDHHVLRSFEDRIAVKEDEKLVAHVQLSNAFREMLESAAQNNLQVEFAVRVRGTSSATEKPAEIHVDEWMTDEPRFAVEASAFLEAVKTHRGRVELAITPKAGSRGVVVHSWQALGNPEEEMSVGPAAGGREAKIVRTDGSIEPLEWFPSFEIRVVRGKNAYPFKTLIERFEPSRPAGYVLIGF
jgi:hypothetical protein